MVRISSGSSKISRNRPSDRLTVGWLAGRGESYAHAFEAPGTIRVAVDQLHVDEDEPIGQPHEIALFPPMTGG